MATTEIYPNAPVALVILEVKHPAAATLDAGSMAAIKAELSDTVPIQRSENGVEVNFQNGEHNVTTFQKLVSRDLHTCVTFGPESFVVETTLYKGWASFKALAERVLAARQEVAPVDGVERIGLRYIDEIRVPDASGDWSRWVNSSLLGPLSEITALGGEPQAHQGMAQFGAGASKDTFVVRYGAGNGQAVVSAPNLSRPGPRIEGPFFLIDIDGSWIPQESGIPELVPEDAMAIVDRLHGPIKGIFESLITNDLRVEVLNYDN